MDYDYRNDSIQAPDNIYKSQGLPSHGFSKEPSKLTCGLEHINWGLHSEEEQQRLLNASDGCHPYKALITSEMERLSHGILLHLMPNGVVFPHSIFPGVGEPDPI